MAANTGVGVAFGVCVWVGIALGEGAGVGVTADGVDKSVLAESGFGVLVAWALDVLPDVCFCIFLQAHTEKSSSRMQQKPISLFIKIPPNIHSSLNLFMNNWKQQSCLQDVGGGSRQSLLMIIKKHVVRTRFHEIIALYQIYVINDLNIKKFSPSDYHKPSIS